jgi:hypothetical protein
MRSAPEPAKRLGTDPESQLFFDRKEKSALFVVHTEGYSQEPKIGFYVPPVRTFQTHRVS